MKTIIQTKNGFVNAEWRNGRYYPEWVSYDNEVAKTFTQRQADILLDHCERNGVEVLRAIWVK